MSQENIKDKYPLFGLAVECFAKDIVRRKPVIDLSKKPSANGNNDTNLVFDMYDPAKEIFGKGSDQREDDR